MTNGPGKSDGPIEPEKSPNNAGQLVAERMEGRGLAKGNLPEQNASRTPSRNDAPSALERVRQTAKKDRKLQFTNLQDLSERVKRGAYRAKPVRRVYIPKADGRQRPRGVTALEDKIVQRAAVEVWKAIYETDFLGFSYGFRPGPSQHQALDGHLHYVFDLWVQGWRRKCAHGDRIIVQFADEIVLGFPTKSAGD